jgi:hypothetical protein
MVPLGPHRPASDARAKGPEWDLADEHRRQNRVFPRLMKPISSCSASTSVLMYGVKSKIARCQEKRDDYAKPLPALP